MRVCIWHVQDGVFRMSLSPDGTLLAVIHFSGRLSLWDVPSLKQRATWSQDQQVRLLNCLCFYVCMILLMLNSPVCCAVMCAGKIVCMTDCINVISLWPECGVRDSVCVYVCVLPLDSK